MHVLSQDLGSRMSVQLHRFLLHQEPSFSSSNPSRLGGKLVILDIALLLPGDVEESVDQRFHRSRSILGDGVSSYIVARGGFSC
jgi:hypothetical protein